MLTIFKGNGIDVTVTVSAAGGVIDEWSITMDGQTINGSDRESLDDSIGVMLNTPPGAVATIAGVGAIRVPHPHAAMAADVMRLDSRQSYYLTDTERVVPGSAALARLLDPFYTI
ncbi:hypothetical protein P5V34_11445 [Mycobacteroides abscessus subsp. abscessus]|jgi:hypothetical protein|uniref:hypothetical protein n=1 Tax=Mycobacteroides abscessus TaxID=36809 RepID=UPI00266D49C7|nr:hypothetical protein [Mycobacteroides abscessus]MDO3014601.1 hypothetical protein [Mycobacteroides abscessus subsp. abscessus]